MIVDLVVIGLAIALYPVPVTAFILILSARGGVRKGAAFIFGWLLSLGSVMAVTVLATGNKPPKSNSAPSVGALAVKIAIGLVLIAFAERQRRRLGRPKPPKKQPKWQTGIDNMSSLFAVGLAPVLQPWGMIAAGVAVVVDAKLVSWESFLGLIFFGLLATSVLLAMEGLSILRPERADVVLTNVKVWIESHTDQIIIVVFAVLGLWLIGYSSYLLATS
jgi:threonine/homoserine/homoserine lactone efflux protein